METIGNILGNKDIIYWTNAWILEKLRGFSGI